MDKIGFLPNIDKDIGLAYAKTLIDWVVDNKCFAFVPEEFSGEIGENNFIKYVKDEEIYISSDFLVVLGGDGTILRVAKKAALFGTPIIGINLGYLGYLTDVEKSEAIGALTKVLNKEYKIENRMMLKAVICSKSLDKERSFIILNEACISRSIFSRLIKMSVHVNDDYIDTYKADGMIISTPTGSTAYNLSAGGPILKPDIELIAITPICPHTLYSRPSVVSSNDIIRIEIKDRQGNATVCFDGQENVYLNEGDTVTIEKSEYYTKILRTSGLGFYDILRLKMVGVREVK